PSSSPLFPYTTLFRSLGAEGSFACLRALRMTHVAGPHANPRAFRYHHSALSNEISRNSTAGMSQRSIWLTTVTPCLLSATSSARDRKSTRLNSSHDQI